MESGGKGREALALLARAEMRIRRSQPIPDPDFVVTSPYEGSKGRVPCRWDRLQIFPVRALNSSRPHVGSPPLVAIEEKP